MAVDFREETLGQGRLLRPDLQQEAVFAHAESEVGEAETHQAFFTLRHLG